ncbi:nickel ABC transporter substrate-binding protein [Aneurinibacillus migulanus]|uniref:Nickel ABC transporter substrate-binding protein n=1 Tax=Aneurinibacillus migulanus TaxID=47500 RepID=A0A0D1WCY2_ANEMI|nr:nickel ABC transporter substrate-binding protein [Aneurinibacillus migulanus]KIV56405.1 nickel ABC transporter substrate-binding protein [Aneurinibacillus migulanus]KON97729.1 nickel ABC transporter substrate-binding protein [Aneurinibacillus migulanus]MED0896177.1 nickel ABC transporter substrate-binding protein [Aneurinibacillus migulanus]MED1619799.1 nickel ABC transporter substrate-binding protein [Aneurinibacillus migulanus]SDK51565.1 nickel transport system substrate-binding protein [
MFKFKRKTILFLVMSLLMSSALLGCTEKESATTPKEGTEKAEKSITLSWPRDIGTMNPHAYNPSQLIAQSMIYEPLISYKEGGKLAPHLAESWSISKDGKEYTFKLRQNVKFSDGTPFNAAIVKKNFDAVMKNPKLHSWLGVINVLDKTEAVNDLTFKMTLKKPYYPTLQDLSLVRPVRFLGEAGFPDDGDTSKGVKKPVGTGPWMLTDYKKDEYAVFTRNPNYWRESPKIEKVTIKIIPDAETRVMAFEKGELDLIYGEGVISMDSFNQLKESGKYVTGLSQPVGTRSLLLNTSNEKLADLKVRLALQHGFNKQAMVEGITHGLEEKADNILSKNFPYTNIEAEPIEYNVDKATAYLEEAGWKLPPGKTVREKNGQPLELELIYDKTDPIQKAMAETIQAEWTTIGVKLNITGVELTVQIKRRKAGEFDLDFWYNYGAPYDPHSFINVVAEKGWGVSEAHSRLPMKQELDQQVNDALASTDETKRQELYGSILKTLQEQSVIVPVSYIKKTVVYQKTVKDFIFPANRDEHPFYGIDTNK